MHTHTQKTGRREAGLVSKESRVMVLQRDRKVKAAAVQAGVGVRVAVRVRGRGS